MEQTFFRWTAADRRKMQRLGYRFDGRNWFRVKQVGDERREKQVSESQVPGPVLDEARANPLLGA